MRYLGYLLCGFLTGIIVYDIYLKEVKPSYVQEFSGECKTPEFGKIDYKVYLEGLCDPLEE